MVCYRALELASINGKNWDDECTEASIFLSDPNLMSDSSDVMMSYAEMYMCILKIGPKDIQRKV